MRDLGVMRTRSDSVTDTARFETKSDAQASWFYANHYSQLAFYNDDMLLAIAEGDADTVLADQTVKDVYLGHAFRL